MRSILLVQGNWVRLLEDFGFIFHIGKLGHIRWLNLNGVFILLWFQQFFIIKGDLPPLQRRLKGHWLQKLFNPLIIFYLFLNLNDLWIRNIVSKLEQIFISISFIINFRFFLILFYVKVLLLLHELQYLNLGLHSQLCLFLYPEKLSLEFSNRQFFVHFAEWIHDGCKN